MTYDNSAYWRGLHQTHPGSLKAVGHPWLSEAFNELKYRSEAETLTGFLDSHRQLIRDDAELRIADIGAGTGFWTEMLEHWFRSKRISATFTVIDISEEALTLIKERHPSFESIRADLTTTDPSWLKEKFGLVVSFYCLHHLPRTEHFLNGLRFAARAVAPNGILLMMDPILSEPYSPFHELVFSNHAGNGVPRSLYLMDDVLESEGLVRIALCPAVSFLLNGRIEARSRIGSAATNTLWTILQLLYRSERASRATGGAIIWADRVLKRHALAFSSSLVAYGKHFWRALRDSARHGGSFVVPHPSAPNKWCFH